MLVVIDVFGMDVFEEDFEMSVGRWEIFGKGGGWRGVLVGVDIVFVYFGFNWSNLRLLLFIKLSYFIVVFFFLEKGKD